MSEQQQQQQQQQSDQQQRSDQQQQQQQQQSDQQQQRSDQQQQQEVPGYLHQMSPETRTALLPLGYKTADELGKAFLSDRQLIGKARLVVPGENATAEEVTAYRKGIGVPDKPEEYDFTIDGKAPDADMEKFGRATFHKHGVPKATATAIVRDWNGHVAATIERVNREQDEKVAQGDEAVAKKWGKDNEAHQDIARRAAEFGGLSSEDVTAMKRAVGPEKVMPFLLAFGQAAAGEGPKPGGGANTFSITTPEQAAAELKRMDEDPDVQKVLADRGHKENKAMRERYNRLTEQSLGIKNPFA